MQLLISIVIPVFNESKRIDKTIATLNHYLKTFTYQHEVIFVDDGSADNTKQAIDSLIPQFNYQIISYPINRGKGYAVRQGVLAAQGDYILMCDADMSTPIIHLGEFIQKALERNDVVIGSRKKNGANVIKHQTYIREKLGQGFTLLSNVFIAPGISDFTCGFKLFSRKAGQHIFSKQLIMRWGFDSEIIFLARKYDYKITELPVSWINDSETKVNLKKDISRSLCELFKILLYNYQHKYS